MAFEHLFKSGHIGPMELKNRIVFPAISNCYCSPDGYVTDEMLDYYEARAKGGAGLVILEATCVESRLGPLGVGRDGQGSLRIDEDKFIPGLAQVARVIQRHGAKAAVQLAHGGREAKSSCIGAQPIAPSAVPRPASGGLKTSEIPRELTVPEIKDLVSRFAKAAARTKKAGFDGVEIHGAHWYLIGQFLSAEANQRQDAYGGDAKRRMRFLLEIIEATRQLVGQDYPLWCRINGGGTGMASTITPDELRMNAKMLEEIGIHAISVSGIVSNQPYLSPMGYFVPFAEILKEVVRVPVMVAGSITPELGENILAKGKADFINIGRGLVVDPELPKKVASKKLREIAPCIRCLQCIHSIVLGLGAGPMRCSVNAAVGKEQASILKPTLLPKKVLVVGGGPAGMEAARVAGLRNHHVVLYDRSDKLGGQMLLASKPPHKGLIAALTDYLEGQIRKLDSVEIHLGRAVDVSLIEQIKPDAVIMATGVFPFIPEIPGIGSDSVVTAQDLFAGKADVGQKVAIIGGELVGCEAAMYLGQKGRQVTVLRRGPAMATDVTPRVREPLLAMLKSLGVSMLTSVKYEEITESGLAIIDAQGSKKQIEADTIVLAAGARSNRDLYNQLKGRIADVYLAGDCVRPANIFNAIHDGFHIGQQL